MRINPSRAIFLGCVCAIALSGCSRIYYATMEKFGREKRDILVGRVEDIRKDQREAKEQFQTTLEAFQAVTGFDGGELESAYKRLDKEYDRCQDRAEDVSKKIDSIEKVARDLFKEWEKETGEIRDPALQSRSEQLRRETESRYRQLASKLRDTEAKMAPVLQTFRDQVLFLKHNLNAQAIDSLKDTVIEVKSDVGALIADIEASIREADEFISAMSSEPGA